MLYVPGVKQRLRDRDQLVAILKGNDGSGTVTVASKCNGQWLISAIQNAEEQWNDDDSCSRLLPWFEIDNLGAKIRFLPGVIHLLDMSRWSSGNSPDRDRDPTEKKQRNGSSRDRDRCFSTGTYRVDTVITMMPSVICCDDRFEYAYTRTVASGLRIAESQLKQQLFSSVSRDFLAAHSPVFRDMLAVQKAALGSFWFPHRVYLEKHLTHHVHDGNSAPQSIRYLNAQLAALWANADDCAKQAGKTPNFKSEKWQQGKYTRALAQYQHFGFNKKSAGKISSVKELLFNASFAKPMLEVICNHELVLHITLAEGHVNTELNANKSGYRFEAKHNHALNGIELSYRMKFSRSSIKGMGGKDSKIGNTGSKHLIQLMILDIDSAKLVKYKPSLPAKVKDALTLYMPEYLQFLRSAGNHVLFNLPDFDDDMFSPNINYSLISRALEVEEFCCDVVHGTSLGEINRYLYGKWLAGAAMGRPKDVLSVCLAEINSTWLPSSSIDSTQFHISFGAPQIKALCSHEVLLYFNIDHIAFFEGSDFSQEPLHVYHGWKVAVIADVVQDKPQDSFTNIFQPSASRATVLTTYSLHIVYHLDTTFRAIHGSGGGGDHGHSGSGGDMTWTDTDGEDDSHEYRHRRQASALLIWNERVEKLTVGGYDQVLAVSELSIKELFRSYYIQATRGTALYECFSHWKSDLFSAEFDKLDVALLSDNRAVVWVGIQEGELAIETQEHHKFWLHELFSKPTAAKKTVKRQFSDVVLAFEVQLKVIEHRELAVASSWHPRFENSPMYQCRKSASGTRVYKHLILDFAHAKYIPQLSVNDGLYGTDHEAAQKLQTVIHYTQDYLEHLAHHGHNIIHSVPVFTAASNSFALTSVTYQVVTKTQITIDTCRHAVPASEAPVILVLGMCGNRPLPSIRLPWFQGWVIPGHQSLGTICLSRETFLEGRLLQHLARVNAKTTLVPEWAGITNGEWKYKLTTLEKHAHRKEERTSWKVANKTEKTREYVWEAHDEWNYDSKHESFTGDDSHGKYTLSCRTKNTLSIPTYYRQGYLEITLHGESTLQISQHENANSWSKTTSAKWSVGIEVHTANGGLRIQVVASTPPNFSNVASEGVCPSDVQEEHMRQFPSEIDLEDTVNDLTSLLQGAWDYSYPGLEAYALANPVFTRSGDLVVELTPYRSAAFNVQAHGSLKHTDSFFKKVKHVLTGSHEDVSDTVSVKSHKSETPTTPAPPLALDIHLDQSNHSVLTKVGTAIKSGTTVTPVKTEPPPKATAPMTSGITVTPVKTEPPPKATAPMTAATGNGKASNGNGFHA
ncbi:hypothetical protein FB45DRAFT_1037536 [Roridomyces roridus]|uniref:Uncharacterized protein n=1 Tax=Roridomyces roridus TaxID=1738132 RepID=A0AAD7B640_9AGAR|nr:hypothetical protein FB45DRAFT_1037536 [Roridomyces roridus]